MHSLVRILSCALFALPLSAWAADELRLAQNLSPISGVVLVAEEKGFFAKQGLNVAISNFTSGRAALQAVLGGGADIATVAESPVTAAIFNAQPVALLARINISDVKTLARADAGIRSLADLKGKRIGFAAGTGSEVYTATLLKKLGLTAKDVTLVALQPQDMVAALSNNSLDAYDVWEPHIANGKKALGARVVELDSRGVYGETFNIVALKPWLADNPKAAQQLLAALVEADDWIKTNRDEAISLIAKTVNLPREELAAGFGDYRYDVTLDDAVLDILKAHATWRLESGNAPHGSTAVPDVTQVVVDGPLRAVAPDRVRLSVK
jgi:NitT/TauT family transport system substrate-binding protein